MYADVDFLDPALDDGASASIGYQAGGIGNDVSWSYNQSGAVTAGTVLTLMDAPAPRQDLGDGNGDCHVDLADLEELAACLDGPLMPTAAGCECYDMTTDGAVDLADYGRFQEEYTGSGQTIPGCTR
ncbi:MAG: hypothetical protein GY778_28480 [bacterium]|nr:hypothetical protein [bacterium]